MMLEKSWIVTITAKTLSICDPYFPKNLKYLALLTVIDHTVIFHTECNSFSEFVLAYVGEYQFATKSEL